MIARQEIRDVMSADRISAPVIYKLIPAGRVGLCLDPMEIATLGGVTDLPARPVTGLGQDARGYLWLGTENGVLLFDGLRCGAPPALARLHGSIVFAFHFVDEQIVWIGTHGSGLAGVRIGVTGPRLVRSLTEAEGLPSNYVHAMSTDRHRRLWVGTPEGVAVIARGAVVRRLGVSDGLPSTQVQALCRDRRGRLWVGTDAGLRVLVDGAVDRDALRGQPCTAGAVAKIYRDPWGRIWVGMRNGELYRSNRTAAGAIELAPVRAGGAAVLALVCDRQDRLWVGTDQGVEVYEQGLLHDAITPAEGLPSPVVRTLLCDDGGRVWAGTQRGLVLLAGMAGAAHPLGGATPETRQAWGFAPTSDGRVWLATDAGLSAVDGCTERALPTPALPEPLDRTTVWSLRPDGHGQLWVGTRRDGLYCLDATTGAPRAHLLADEHAGILALCLVGDRDLWAATARHGVLCLDTCTHRITRWVGAAEGLPDAGALALGLDPHGQLWAGTISGRLVCIDPASGMVRHTIALDHAGPPRLIHQLCIAPDGTIWVSTNGGGLVCVDAARAEVVRTVTVADGLPSDILYGSQLDDGGHLWLGTGRGVSRFTPATGQVVTIDQGFGLPHDECNFGALCFDDRGRLWVGTVLGVAVLDPALLPDGAAPCPVHLTAFRVMGKEREPAADLELEDSAYDLQFEYAAVTFTAPLSVRYRVQLLGLEADWSAPTRERARRYTNLRPGAYTFRVSASSWAGTWGPPLEVAFRVVRNRQARVAEERLERERIEKEVYRATAARLEELNGELAAARQAAERARAQAEELAELRSGFVATVSHELRSPLTAMLGYAELLQAHWSRLDEAARLERIDHIVLAANRQRRMVEDLLLLSRLELGALTPTPGRFLLAGAAGRAADEVRASYRTQQIALEGLAALEAWADAERTVQVLVILLDNAAKYSPEGAPIGVHWWRGGGTVTVQVRDRGPGIPEKGREQLFTRFGRVPGSRPRTGRTGTGLGLHLGRSLARAMAGDLVLEDTGPAGSVFRLTLPAWADPSAEYQRAAPQGG
jgi:signal transduction histidine kinase/ligand-binding sensor domain-containing protein